jgi:signal transduction histidine kinase
MSPDDRTNLLSHIAHELRTPLSVALGYTKILAAGRYGPLNDKQTQAVSAAERCCEQIGELAEQLSLLAKLERGELTLRRGPVALDPLLSTLAAQHAPLPDHPVRVEQAPGAALTVHADGPHLRRALATLLAAVIRTAPDESTVVLTARAAAASDADPSPLDAAAPARSRRVTAFSTNSSCAIVGIALASQLDALLDADEQTLDPLNDYEAGLGLGLALARQMTAAFGGRVGSRRTDGMIAVRLLLPLSPAAAQAPRSSSSAASS